MNVDGQGLEEGRAIDAGAGGRWSAPAECCVPLGVAGMSEEEAETIGDGLQVDRAIPHRVRIVNLLATAGQPLCVCDLTPQLGLSQPTVSFHLKKLVQAGLLDREQRGVWAYYSLNREALERLATVFRLKEEATR